MKRTALLIALLVGLALPGQAPPEEALHVSEKDKIYPLAPAARYFVDSSMHKSWEEIKHQTFLPVTENNKTVRHTLWYRFFINPQVEADSLIFYPYTVDYSEIYVPYHDGYRYFKVGSNTKNKVSYDILESSVLFLPADSLDFSRPFYFNKKTFTDLDLPRIHEPGFLIMSDKSHVWYHYVLKNARKNTHQLYIGIIFISFILFLINYLVSGDKNFLFYSIYLFFVTFIFLNQIPWLRNHLNQIYPFTTNILVRLSIIMASAAYIRFAINFMNLEKHLPRMKKWFAVLIYGALLYALIKLIQMILFPFFPYQYESYFLFHFTFMLLSLYIFYKAFFTPLDRNKKIVLYGSLLLIAGHLLSMFLDSDYYFLNTVLGEIIIFSAVVSLQNKNVFKQQLNYKLALLSEKNKRQALQELDRMKTRFFSNISHEFRTPLTLVNASLNRLEDKITDPDGIKNINNIRRYANRLLELVNQLLDIGKIQSRQLRIKNEEVPLYTFLITVIESFSSIADNKEITFLNSILIDEKSYILDKDLLQKILTNLLSNAFKYTPDGGQVICKAFVENNRFIFEIKNTGEGLTEEEKEKIFQRFYQKNEFSEGVGLGLSLVHEWVQALNGSIHVNSKPGAWTEFRVELPVRPVNEYPEAGKTLTDNRPEQNATETSDKPRLLIVEDHTEVRGYLKKLFTEGFEVWEASDGDEGFRKAVEIIPDIIISDVMMPKKDGYELCKTIKNDIRTAHIPVILLTAKAGKQSMTVGTECGAVDYIVKPFHEDVLKMKVENLMDTLEKNRKRFKENPLFAEPPVDKNTLDHKFLQSVKEIVQSQLANPDFDTELFARKLNMSRVQLYRKLKALTGLPPGEFIRSQRLKYAARLLEISDANINEVAFDAGFGSAAYFSKCFKETYGITPTEYAERFRKNKFSS